MSVPMVAAAAVLGGQSADVRPSDPITSHAARDAANADLSEGAVLKFIREEGPVIDEQIILGIQADAAWGRCPDFSESRIRTARKALERQGLVRTTGAVKLTSRGRRAQVWEATS